MENAAAGSTGRFRHRYRTDNLLRDFIKMAFAEVGIEIECEGKNENEVVKIKECKNPLYQIEIGKTVIKVDPEYFRPTEVDLLVGDSTKANTQLNWKPKYDLPALVADMMASDLKLT